MKGKTGRVFIFSIATGILITMFQVFWLYQTFRSGAGNFVRLASNDLQKSINTYQLNQNADLLHFNGKGSPVTLFMNNSARQLTSPGKWHQIKDSLSPANNENVRMIISGMLSQVSSDPVVMKSIGALYRKQLLKDGMPTKFGFIVFPNSKYLKNDQVSATLGLSTSSPVVVAAFEGTDSYLFRQNLLPVLVSVFLLLITFGCLWYMHTVIHRQVQLDMLKNDFINNMAHEFRTPVAILRSTHEALTKFDGLEDLEKTQRYLHANESVLRKMEGDLDRILAIAPFENGGPRIKDEIIAIDALMHELLTPYRVLETADFRIENQLRDNAIHSDRYLLGSALTNLIDNAIKYGGERIIITFSVANDENYWRIAISDNGKGIMPQHLPHIFDKFYRAPQDDRHDTKGFGLGLSYVKQLTQALGGSINVKSRPGEGTTFTLTFPWKK